TNTNLSWEAVCVNNFFHDLFWRFSTPRRSLKATSNNLSRITVQRNSFFQNILSFCYKKKSSAFITGGG
ncbi:hypothetical protein, partial [Halobacillus sp. Cin3]|uniref:hypothetical protein n=1 Tax=Halobacillus sp. Cin3 TaxID=2928441 RepID=UPI00248DB209